MPIAEFLFRARARARPRARARARAKGLGLGLASEAEFEFETLPPTFSIVADVSGARLRCLLELRITLVRSLAQCAYRGSQNKLFRKTYLRAFGWQRLLRQGNENI